MINYIYALLAWLVAFGFCYIELNENDYFYPFSDYEIKRRPRE